MKFNFQPPVHAPMLEVCLLLLACLVALYRFEQAAIRLNSRRTPRPLVSLSIFLLILTASFALTGSPTAGLLLTLYLIILIGSASKAKARHTGFNLVFDDLRYLHDGAAQFLSVEYRIMALTGLGGFVLLTTALLIGLIYLPDDHVDWIWRPLPFLVASVIVWRTFQSFDWRDWFGVFVYTMNHSHISGFMVSPILANRPLPYLRLMDVAEEPLPLPAPRLSSQMKLPDVIVIQHESTFDPRIYGLTIGGRARRFMYPSGGAISGRLRVDIFGGHSWMTEFALMTGLSSLSFGANSRYIYHKAAGNIRHALPLYLKTLGYKTSLMTPTSRRFLNYDKFYSSIGVDNRIFMNDLGAPYDDPKLRREQSDRLFYDAALTELENAIGTDGAPQMMILLTSFNHGPHSRRRLRGETSKAGWGFAMEKYGDREYAEYYARMMFCAHAYLDFRQALERRFPNRPMLVIRYGDHQPKLVRNILKAQLLAENDPRILETFYSIEGINLELEVNRDTISDPLDVAFLGTVALQAAGLPLSPIHMLHLSLMEECGGSYAGTPSKLRAKFHRTLIDNGLIRTS